MTDRCPTCDRPLATRADSLNPALNPDDGEGTDALCWRNWYVGNACPNPPVDWRARALAAADRISTIETALGEALGHINEITSGPNDGRGACLVCDRLRSILTNKGPT